MTTAIRKKPLAEIIGAKGGGTQRTPVEAPDSLSSDSLAHILDLVSEGEIKGLANGLQSIYYDETPLQNADGTSNFDSVQIDFRPGSQDQDHIAGHPDVENEVSVGVELRSDISWTQSINNVNLSAVSIRLSVLALSRSDTTNGDINGYSIAYAIDCQTDGGAFETVLNSSFTGKTVSKYERNHRIDLPKATQGWVVRVRRLTVNADSSTIADTTRVESFTEIIDVKLRYPNSAIIGSILNAQQFPNIPSRSFDLFGRIIRVPSNYDPDTRAYAGVWDGTFKLAWSNNPAWVFYDIVTHTRYGLGHLVSDSIADKWSLYSIGQYCDGMVDDGSGVLEPRFSCNVYLQTRADAYKVIQDLSSIFRGISFWAGGAIMSVADMPTDPAYLYTSANVLGGKFIYQGTARKNRHTVALVTWNDMTDFGRAKVEYVEDLEGIDRYGVQQIEVTAIGCTSRSQARRLGKWMLLTERYETDSVTFSVGLDGAVAAPGQVIKVADPLRAGKRIGGRISAATASTVTVDADTPVNIGDRLSVILPSAVAEQRTVTAVNGRTFTLDSPWSATPVPHSVWIIESDQLAAKLYRVIGVTESEGLTFNISAIEHYAGKYAEVELGIKYEEPNTTGVPYKVQVAPESVTLESREVAGEVNTTTAMTVSWPKTSGAVKFRVEARQAQGAWQSLGETGALSYDVYGIAPGTFTARVTAISATGANSTPTQSADFVVQDQTTHSGTMVTVLQDIDAANAAILQESIDRADAIAAEAQARADAISAAIATEVTDRTDAIAAEAQARADALLNEQLARESAITTEQSLRQSADDSLAQSISTLSAGTGEQFDSKKVWYFDTDLEQWNGDVAPTVDSGFLRAGDSGAPYLYSPTGLDIDGLAYRYAKARVKRVGSPVWKGELRYRLVGDAAGAWRGPVTTPEPPYDTAHDDATIDFKDVVFGGQIDQIRLDLVTAQTATDYLLVDWVALGRPTPGASIAALQDESAARINADAAEATSRQTLAAQMRGDYTGTDAAQLSQGLLYSEQQARVTADSAMASDISSLQAQVGDNAAAIATESQARVDGDNAVASTISSLTSRVDTTEATLVNELITRATKDAVVIDQVNNMDGRLTNAEDGLTAASNTVSGYESRMTAVEGGLSSQSDEITSLQNSVTDLNTGLSATNSSLSDLSSNVTINKNDISAQGSSITSLQSSLDSKTVTIVSPTQPATTGRNAGDMWVDSDDNNKVYVWDGTAWKPAAAQGTNTFVQPAAPTAKTVGDLWFDSDDNNKLYRWDGTSWVAVQDPRISANATAITNLTTRVTSAEGNISANSTSITNLNSTVSGKADASAVNALTTRVTTNEGNISSQATSITSLSTTQSNHTASITSQQSSINGLLTQASLTLDSNGYVTGWKLNNNGSSGTMTIVADKFQIVAPAGGARTEYSNGNWRIYDASNVLRVRLGVW